MRDGFHAALHGDTVGAAQQVQSFFVPEIDARLKADLHRTPGNAFQQAAHVLSNTKDLVDEIDVLNAAGNQRVHFLEHRIHGALAEFVAEQRLVAESASPRAAASKFQLSAQAVV